MNSLNGSKILFVVNSFSGGGAENSVMGVTRNLREKGIPVRLCALNRNSPQDSPDLSNGLYLLERRWKSGLIATVRNLLMFRHLLVELRPEILIANCELPELYIALVAPSSSVIVVVEHTSQPWRGRRMLGRLVRTILRFRGASWVTVSPTDNKIWLGSNSPLHIPNPITTPHNWKSNDRPRTEIVFIGRLREEKRPQWVIEASIQNELRVDLFGDGDQREMLESEYVNTSNDIQFHGYVTNPWDQISLDSLVVVPSEYEGDGMVVAEAIIRNHPVLLADNSDLRRFDLPDRNYFRDQSELADKLRIWKESKEEAFTIPDEVVNSLDSERDIEKIGERWNAFLTQLAKKTKK
jgi:glycosyltransferase involved in cell wall biosynthesis